MLTSTGLFRFLLSLVTRLRRSSGRVTLSLRAWFASFWRSILSFARPRTQPQVRLHALNVPAVDNNPTGGQPQSSEHGKAEAQGNKGLTTLPVRGIAYWQNELSKYQALTLNREFEDPLPATPEVGSQRYEPRTVKQSVELLKIPAGQKTLLSAQPPLPDGWTRHIHPEGNVLFHHKGLHIFTENDIFDHGNDILFHATKLIQQAMENGDVILDELTEIVLNVDGSGRWHYYFVDHSNRLLFWVDSVTQEDLGTGLQGINGYNHIRYLVEARYWYASSSGSSGMSRPVCIVYDIEPRSHCEYYPHNRTLPEGVFEDLIGMLNYAKTDMMTADSSTSPFTQDELAAIADLVNSLKGDGKIDDPYSIWIIARLMAFFVDDQFLNFCGQPCARLNADTPLFGPQTWNHGIAFKFANWLLLWQPNEHAVRLQRVWVDDIIIQPRWKDFISRLKDELGRYTLFSTVMLAVNFSFLAVPGVVTVGSHASSIQIIIYCSVVSTIGSIVFSLVLLNVYNDPGLMGASLAAEVMKTLSQRKWGMARLAITHSLPISCLMWSIVLFFVALAVQIFLPRELPTSATLGVEFAILALLVIGSLHVMRRFYKDEDGGDEETSVENDSSDVEQGLTKC